MALNLYNITFVLGLALMVLGLIGGGLEIKEIKIPTLPAIPRAASFLLGGALIFFCFEYPDVFSGGTLIPTPSSSSPQPERKEPPPPPKPTPQPDVKFLSGPILVAYSPEQKPLADKLNEYLRTRGYLINPHLDDFSGIKPEAREKPGTIRIVYKQATREAEVSLVNAMRAKFPSEMHRLVESQNNNASVDLQVQLW